ncbi:MAG: LytR/AlgR family response regulator transcription factor [Flavisolibacter sp.]
MLRAIIIEDEHAALQQFISILKEAEPDVQIVATIASVQEGIRYLSSNPQADIIFSDVQLADGLSFDIFNATRLEIPIIFITGFDHFMMNAFEHNGIDYLLKPIDKADLSKALLKYKKLENHFVNYNNSSVEKLSRSFLKIPKQRIIVHKGMENVTLRLDEVVLFYTENKVVYVFDRSGRKFLCDKNLSDLENELDAGQFFRVNRQYIVNIDFIKSYKAYERVKLQLSINVDTMNLSIVISQETAPAFRKWVAGEYVK